MDLQGIGDRLREAISDKPGHSINAFQKEMEARGVPGASYTMVHAYLRQDTRGKRRVPSLEFIEAAAEVLRVRPVWLLTGEGGMREGDALHDDEAATTWYFDRLSAGFDSRMRARIPEYEAPTDLLMTTLIRQVVGSVVEVNHPGLLAHDADYGTTEYDAWLLYLGGALDNALDQVVDQLAWNYELIDGKAHPSGDLLTWYITTALQSLYVLMTPAVRATPWGQSWWKREEGASEAPNSPASVGESEDTKARTAEPPAYRTEHFSPTRSYASAEELERSVAAWKAAQRKEAEEYRNRDADADARQGARIKEGHG